MRHYTYYIDKILMVDALLRAHLRLRRYVGTLPSSDIGGEGNQQQQNCERGLNNAPTHSLLAQ